jgi:hypothetical protein
LPAKNGGRVALGVGVPTAKLPEWVQAIGSVIAKRFDFSREPLPLEMDLMLRLLPDAEETRRNLDLNDRAHRPTDPERR